MCYDQKMFKKITYFLPGVLYDIPHVSEHPDFESAETAGLHQACLRDAMKIWIEECKNSEDRGETVASWSKLDNYWRNFKDDEGSFISSETFFAKDRTSVERFALSNDFNIRIRPDGMHFKVFAGKNCTPIERGMLPWVREAVEEVQRKLDYREEDGLPPLTPEETLDAFTDYLRNRVQKSLDKNPKIWCHLRRSGVFRKI